MALQKTIPTQFGVDATYHKISAIQWNFGSVVLTMSSYKDVDAREENKAPLVESTFSFIIEGDAFTRPNLYVLLKSQPDFIGATDV